jgi:excinuclease UvrABC nuclease subunit
MCLAPCFAGCTQPEYVAEVERVQTYLDTRGQSLVGELEKERDAASSALDFERASALHARTEKVKAPWTGIPEIIGHLAQLRAVIVQRSALEDHVALFEFRDGLLHGPVQLGVEGMQHPNPRAGSTSLFAHPHRAEAVPLENSAAKPAQKSKALTLEARVAEALGTIRSRKAERGEVADHLALFKRWYFRSTKKGEVFITHSSELPLRRIVRGISRVAKGETLDASADGPTQS